MELAKLTVTDESNVTYFLIDNLKIMPVDNMQMMHKKKMSLRIIL